MRSGSDVRKDQPSSGIVNAMLETGVSRSSGMSDPSLVKLEMIASIAEVSAARRRRVFAL